jgi:5'-nucleotidase
VLRAGTAPRIGVYDVDALYTWFQTRSPLSPAASARIGRVN